jgi:D-serine deaminase-like pyridoxal phosphate-dependent protein
MTNLSDIATPALLLDRKKVERNIARMAQRASELHVPLRPHGKTPKCDPVAAMLIEAGAIGLTVSTLAEAEGYFAGGVGDIFYAVGLSPDKVTRVAALAARGCRITALVDHPDMARQIAAQADSLGAIIPLVIEIDVDNYRAGILPQDPRFLQLASAVHAAPSLELRGIMSYGGASYGCSAEAAAELAEMHRLALLSAAEMLRNAGLPCEMVSFGSSPATLHALSMEGLTELRCGIYVFQDLFQAAIGACAIDDIALSVLTTVIGVREDLNRVIIDAGGLAMSKDLSTAKTDQNAGFGLVCDESGAVIPDVYISVTSQELGLLSTFCGRPLPYDRMPLGAKLRILPNHADMTAAAYPGYHVLSDGLRVEDFWTRHNGW